MNAGWPQLTVALGGGFECVVEAHELNWEAAERVSGIGLAGKKEGGSGWEESNEGVRNVEGQV